MPFIFTDGLHKAGSDKRKLIRQHVMVGKNRGKTRKGNTKTSRQDLGSSMPYSDGPSAIVFKMRYPSIPNKVGNELSFSKFAAPVEPVLLQEMLSCKF
jgi:hypothetical protein